MSKDLNESDLNQVVGGGIVCLPRLDHWNPNLRIIFPTSEGTVLRSGNNAYVARWCSPDLLTLEEQGSVNSLPETSRHYNSRNEFEVLCWNRDSSGNLSVCIQTSAQPVDMGGNEYALIR